MVVYLFSSVTACRKNFIMARIITQSDNNVNRYAGNRFDFTNYDPQISGER